MTLDDLVDAIRAGRGVRQADVLPHLLHERRADRCEANLRLAEAFADAGNFPQARVLAQRAWVLSAFSPALLPLYARIHEALEDVESIRGAYKRLGMIAANAGRTAEALWYFNEWQYAHVVHHAKDRYAYDFDVLDCIDRLAAPHRFAHPPRPVPRDRRLRLAYLVQGVAEVNSVLVKIHQMLARYHDKSRFDVRIFVPESGLVLSKRHAREAVERFRAHGCEVVTAPLELDDLNRLHGLAKRIHDFEPDALVGGALLVRFEQYYLASLRPAPITIGLLQGPPPQFVAPSLDWSISWSRHPLIDSPCDTSWLLIGLDLPDRAGLRPVERATLGIPEGAPVLLSAGRYVKFSDRRLWSVVRDVLAELPQAHYVVVGAEAGQLPFTPELMRGSMERVHFLGWRSDPLELLCMADAVLDTFPSGGGHVLVDAMALGVPFASFENDYMGSYDQTDWSVADEFVTIPELVVPRGDLAACRAVVLRLLTDGGYRDRMGQVCRDAIRRSMGSPEASVRKLEQQIVSVIQRGPATRDTPGQLRALARNNALQGLRNFVGKTVRRLSAFR